MVSDKKMIRGEFEVENFIKSLDWLFQNLYKKKNVGIVELQITVEAVHVGVRFAGSFDDSQFFLKNQLNVRIKDPFFHLNLEF